MTNHIILALAVAVMPVFKGGEDEGGGGGGGGCGGGGGGDGHEWSAGTPTGMECPDDAPTYQNFGKQFVEDYCLRCHSTSKVGDDRNGAPVAHDYDDVSIVRREWEHIDQMAGAGEGVTNTLMPPTAPRPSAEERKKLAQWLACGAP
jgi:hypothetical protein